MQKLTVLVPDEIDLSGYEDVAEWKPPEVGKPFLTVDGKIIESTCSGYRTGYRIVLTPKPKFPESLRGLKCAGIARDKCGDWYAHEVTPERTANSWPLGAEGLYLPPEFFPELAAFDHIPWDKSFIAHPDCQGD